MKISLYKENKDKIKGTKVICPSCGNSFIKIRKNHYFCRIFGKTVCKDSYHIHLENLKKPYTKWN